MAELTPKELHELLAKLNNICEQAQELQRVVRDKMTDSRRRDQQDRGRQPERRKVSRGK
jgi:hypothetical protein